MISSTYHSFEVSNPAAMSWSVIRTLEAEFLRWFRIDNGLFLSIALVTSARLFGNLLHGDTHFKSSLKWKQSDFMRLVKTL